MEKRVERNNKNTEVLSLGCEIKVHFSSLRILVYIFQNFSEEHTLLSRQLFGTQTLRFVPMAVGGLTCKEQAFGQRGRNNKEEEK